MIYEYAPNAKYWNHRIVVEGPSRYEVEGFAPMAEYYIRLEDLAREEFGVINRRWSMVYEGVGLGVDLITVFLFQSKEDAMRFKLIA